MCRTLYMVSLNLYLSRTAGHGKHRDLVQVNQNRLVMNSVQHWFRLVRTNTRHLTEIPRTEMAWRFLAVIWLTFPVKAGK